MDVRAPSMISAYTIIFSKTRSKWQFINTAEKFSAAVSFSRK